MSGEPRIEEGQIRIAALIVCCHSPNGFISTTELIYVLRGVFCVEGEDKKILQGRNDDKFSQKVRNIISHRSERSSVFYNCFAEYKKGMQGMEITEKGRKLVKRAEATFKKRKS